jgi:Pin2-interacting protein X1
MAYAADLCGSKLKAKLAYTLNEASAAPMSNTSFAAKQMAKMGWTEGTGLGRKRDGIISHIKVKKREDNMGLGVEKERTRKLGAEGMWWSANVSETLMRLQQKSKKSSSSSSEKKTKKGKKKDKKSKKKSKEITMKIYTDEELFEATGGARFGMRASRRAEGKWKRTEDSQDLKKWEEEVKSKVEWNGLGKARVLLSQSTSSSNNTDSKTNTTKRKRSDDDDSEEKKKENDIELAEGTKDSASDGTPQHSKEEQKRLKKKRKTDKKKKSKKKSKGERSS